MEESLEKKLKEEYISFPEEFYKPLTFKELNEGDKYISLPVPGDNEGHGGFRGTHNIFGKIKPIKNNFGVYENAVRLNDGILSSHPDDLYIIKVL
jgi:hypothetical protein